MKIKSNNNFRKQAMLAGFLLALSCESLAFGMHIMEGFLPIHWCLIWGALCLPSLFFGMKYINRVNREDVSSLLILAMAAAFTFVLSALKIPSVTGSSSHMTVLGFAAIVFGPAVASVMSLVVLLFQALLLAHGGLTTLGANTFSMGVVGPLVAFAIYKLLQKGKAPRSLAIFSAAALGDLATYVVTSTQLALAFPAKTGGFLASFTRFATVFAVTQIPLAIIEGLLTVLLCNVLAGYGQNLFLGEGKELSLEK